MPGKTRKQLVFSKTGGHATGRPRALREQYAKLGLAETGVKLTGEPLDHFRRFYNDCISNGSPVAVKVALDFFGSDHILFGTDFPFGPHNGEQWPLDELRTIKTMPMDEDDRANILYRNAKRLLKLPSAARRA